MGGCSHTAGWDLQEHVFAMLNKCQYFIIRFLHAPSIALLSPNILLYFEKRCYAAYEPVSMAFSHDTQIQVVLVPLVARFAQLAQLAAKNDKTLI